MDWTPYFENETWRQAQLFFFTKGQALSLQPRTVVLRNYFECIVPSCFQPHVVQIISPLDVPLPAFPQQFSFKNIINLLCLCTWFRNFIILFSVAFISFLFYRTSCKTSTFDFLSIQHIFIAFPYPNLHCLQPALVLLPVGPGFHFCKAPKKAFVKSFLMFKSA